MDVVLASLATVDWLELAGLISGLWCVWLLIYQRIGTWPMGILYTCISLWILLQAHLYASLGLHVVFLVLNCYGWWFWLRGRKSGAEALPVTGTDQRLLAGLLITALIMALLLGTWFASHTDAILPYWDASATMLSLVALWLSARKKVESWPLWLLIDALFTGIYLHSELYFYMLLYFVYMGMAVMGWRDWRRAMLASASA